MELEVYSNDPTDGSDTPYVHRMRIGLSNPDFSSIETFVNFEVFISDCPSDFTTSLDFDNFNLVTFASPLYYVIDEDAAQIFDLPFTFQTVPDGCPIGIEYFYSVNGVEVVTDEWASIDNANQVDFVSPLGVTYK